MFLGTHFISGEYFCLRLWFLFVVCCPLCLRLFLSFTWILAYSVVYFRYRVSQRIGAELPAPMLPGLPPYCLMLRRIEDAQMLSTGPPSSTGVRVTASELPHVHRGSRDLLPFSAVGEFVHLAVGLPPTTAPHGTHHRFNLHWECKDEGNWALFTLVVFCFLFLCFCFAFCLRCFDFVFVPRSCPACEGGDFFWGGGPCPGFVAYDGHDLDGFQP